MRNCFAPVRLVAALGNGLFGRATRHSIGLRLLEELADAHGAAWTWRFALCSHVARISLDDDEVVALLWPALPYNVIGWCVAAATSELGLSAAAVTVVHDDLELAPGQVRFKDGGSAGGNNGLKSTIASLGSDGFRRLRVGVGRPEERDSATVAAYVLSTMPADELELATRAFEQPEIRARLLRPGGRGS